MNARRRADTEALIAETERMRSQLIELSSRLDSYVRALQTEIDKQQEARAAHERPDGPGGAGQSPGE